MKASYSALTANSWNNTSNNFPIQNYNCRILICFTPQSPSATSLSKHTALRNSCSTPSMAVTLLHLKSDWNELEAPNFQVCRVKADKQNRHRPPCYSCPAALEKTPCQAAKASLSFTTYRATSQPPAAPHLTLVRITNDIHFTCCRSNLVWGKD